MSEYGCKVCRVLDEYGMERYEERLLEQWQADPSQRKGYRQLAEWFNTLMLRREMDRAGLSTLGDEAESKYERLQSDEAVAAEVATELENAGIPIETLRDDFVSYGVIRTHLKECLESDIDLSSGDWEQNAIEISRDHASTKIEEAVRSLRNKGRLTAGGDVSVSVTVELECENCHARVPSDRAIRREYVCRCDD
ncbi:rod-determining factor RdfA [Natrinema sp. SYSU A 869]|uniref:rod-determining factor RdfA n=1 Tax=Natrinema sp. SYSU A 869 TaxID=2871694 RepID=UPI001CA3A564|nr:rod-determining factor RdfA [Natrinema sp. SYSU A 869]